MASRSASPDDSPFDLTGLLWGDPLAPLPGLAPPETPLTTARPHVADARDRAPVTLEDGAMLWGPLPSTDAAARRLDDQSAAYNIAPNPPQMPEVAAPLATPPTPDVPPAHAFPDSAQDPAPDAVATPWWADPAAGDVDAALDLEALAVLAELGEATEVASDANERDAPPPEPLLELGERRLTYGQLTDRLHRTVLPRLRARADFQGYIILQHLARAVVELQGSDPHLRQVRTFLEQVDVPLLATGALRGVRGLPSWAVSEARLRFGDLLADTPDEALVIRRLEYEGIPLSAGTRAFLVQAWLHHKLSRTEEHQLALVVAAEVARMGEDVSLWSTEARAARDALITDNLWLVARVARKYVHRGVELDDLLQEGALGLFRAVVKFDPSLGYRFVTYAGTWVFQSITRSLGDDSRLIRMPIHLHERGKAIFDARVRLRAANGREPDLAAIAQDAGTTVETVRAHLVTCCPISLDDPQYAEKIAVLPSRLDEPVDVVAHDLLREQTSTVLATLSERERDVLVMRYGVDDGRSRTLEEVGKEFGVTRERIRQIEAKALRKLRHPNRAKKLRDFQDSSIPPTYGITSSEAADILSGVPAQERAIVVRLWGLDNERPTSIKATARSLGMPPEDVERVAFAVARLVAERRTARKRGQAGQAEQAQHNAAPKSRCLQPPGDESQLSSEIGLGKADDEADGGFTVGELPELEAIGDALRSLGEPPSATASNLARQITDEPLARQRAPALSRSKPHPDTRPAAPPRSSPATERRATQGGGRRTPGERELPPVRETSVARVRTVLDQLSPLDRTIATQLWGVDGDQVTVGEISQRLHRSHAYVRGVAYRVGLLVEDLETQAAREASVFSGNACSAPTTGQDQPDSLGVTLAARGDDRIAAVPPESAERTVGPEAHSDLTATDGIPAGANQPPERASTVQEDRAIRARSMSDILPTDTCRKVLGAVQRVPGWAHDFAVARTENSGQPSLNRTEAAARFGRSLNYVRLIEREILDNLPDSNTTEALVRYWADIESAAAGRAERSTSRAAIDDAAQASGTPNESAAAPTAERPWSGDRATMATREVGAAASPPQSALRPASPVPRDRLATVRELGRRLRKRTGAADV